MQRRDIGMPATFRVEANALAELAQHLEELLVVGRLTDWIMDVNPDNFARLIYNEERAFGHACGMARAVEVGHVALRIEIAEQRIIDVQLLGPSDERVTGIHADTKHLRIIGVEALKLGLI